ncbi:pseudouridine synthase, RluA family [Propionibacterium acidifaciens F0233]|uniref:Pseudouridine synthase n=1 Tax=Propionibacterium acidifaciens F0233 TaxID=553198 RepID=U2Q671_9ACTN|nr:RluA family pseudouridine synthase [Propionibacterium acidifaciens]AYW78332.1 RluA family pseudouridine synthase [Propionibacterium acidifaciens]ERK51524.1 pseudouridine synthase, RluA family [Propionibacterium acidifaciens F0233]
MSVLFVPDGLAGERVDAAAARMTGLTRSRVAGLIAEGLVLLDGAAVARPSQRVRTGQLLDIDLSEPVRRARVVPAVVEGMTIVHDDPDVVVVDKPAGVAAHPSLGWDGPDVVSGLAGAGFRITTSGAAERQGIVHRLDVGTSGLMVVAKSERAYTALKRAFRERTVDKAYLALVQGHLDPLEGTIDAPIGRHPGSEWKFAVTAGGRAAVTHYEVIEMMRATCLVRVRLETGRTHQIRVHFAALHHPCVGDPLYGSDPGLAARLGLDRQWLHAAELGFVHPGTGGYVRFASEPPADLARALELVRD